MNLIRNLKKTIRYHLIVGIFLSVTLCALIITSKYKYGLLKATADLESIRVNALKIEYVIKIMRKKQSVAASILPVDYHSRSHREMLLLAIERAKSAIKGTDITVGNFIEENDELTLPVALEFTVHQYYEGVNAIGYLQDSRFPYFKLQSIVIKKDEVDHKIVWRVEGSFRMPAERVMITDDRRAAR